MAGEVDLARIGAALAHPTRSAMLLALLSGEVLGAGALADAAHVTPSAASRHLALLRESGLVERSVRGRRHVFRLAGDDLAEAVEALGRVSPVRPAATLRERQRLDALTLGRTCYDHLAGRLGVAVTDALVHRGVIADETGSFLLTSKGERWFADLGLDVPALHTGRRALTRACLDWTERRPHLAGALGAAFATHCLEFRWLRRVPGSRAVTPTRIGAEWLRDELGIGAGTGRMLSNI